MVDNPTPAVEVTQEDRERRNSLSFHEQMLDAQAQCIPCKLCGGKAKIADAGVGAGYYIHCENSRFWRHKGGCMVGEKRLGGWAYNVMDAWNRLHATPSRGGEVEKLREAAQFLSDRLDDLEWLENDLEATLRDFMGHVDPAHARLKFALASPPPVDADTPAASEGGIPPHQWHAYTVAMLAEVKKAGGDMLAALRISAEAGLAASEGAVPAGFVLVPVEPTEAMWDAFDAYNGDKRTGYDTWRNAWSAMLATAPKPASDTGTRVEAGEEWPLIQRLRDEEADSVTILCDNPDGPPNAAVECCGFWTGFAERRFEGDSVLDALKSAVAAKDAAARLDYPDLAASPATATGGVREHQIKLVASALCRAAGMDPDGGPVSGYGWHNHEGAAIELLAALHPVDSRAQGGEAA